MNAIQRIFGRDEKFYDLLEASAIEANNSASVLTKLLGQMAAVRSDQALSDLSQSRRKHKRITQEITEQLCKNFVTPLEREDIEALSSALYKIPKNVEKIGERMLILPVNLGSENLAKQISMLEQATEVVAVMVKKLRLRSHVENISDSYERLQTVEGDADKLMTALLRDLFNGDSDAKEMIVLKDIYELLEKTIDRCRDAGNVVFQVVLKYS